MESHFLWNTNPVSERNGSIEQASTSSLEQLIKNQGPPSEDVSIKSEPYKDPAYGEIRIEAEEAKEDILGNIKTEIFGQPVFPGGISLSEQIAADNVQSLTNKIAYQNYLNEQQSCTTSQLVLNHHIHGQQSIEHDTCTSNMNGGNPTVTKYGKWNKYNTPGMFTNTSHESSDLYSEEMGDEDKSPNWLPTKKISKRKYSKRHIKKSTKEKVGRKNWKHECTICNKKCRTKQHVREHESTHTGLKAYQCHICNKLLTAASSLRRHIQTHQNDRPLFPCEKCGKVFKDRKSVTGHRPCNELSFSCEICGKSYTRMDLLKSHARTHTEEKSFVCLICAKAFFTNYLLKRHQLVHSETGVPLHVCSICGKAFKDPRSVNTHKPCNFANYNCDQCEKSFTRMDLLKLHMRGHLGLRPFCCPICSKMFTTQSSLKRHIITHSENRILHNCQNCGRSFKDPKAFKTHRPCSSTIYPCDVCEKSYTRPDLLKSHMKSHAEVKPFPCEVCDKSFVSRPQLKRHYTVHLEENQHACLKCDHFFKTMESLKTHSPCNNTERVICNLCGNSYVTHAVLRRHMKQVHSVNDRIKTPKPPEKCYSCGLCDRKIKLKLLMQFHSNKHSNDKTFRCLECNKWFSKVSQRIMHTRSKHWDGLPCYKCGKHLYQPGMLKIHLKAHRRPYKCVRCYKRMPCLERLVVHRINKHGVDPAKYVGKVIQCYICGDCFGSQAELVNHGCSHKLYKEKSSFSKENHFDDKNTGKPSA